MQLVIHRFLACFIFMLTTFEMALKRFKTLKAVADLREGPGGGRPPPLILGKKEEMTEGKMADRASKSRPPPPPPPLAQGLDPPLERMSCISPVDTGTMSKLQTLSLIVVVQTFLHRNIKKHLLISDHY